MWNAAEDYLESGTVIMELKMILDTADRIEELSPDYNTMLTNDEDQKQYLLQVVNTHRHQFPDSKKKKTLSDCNSMLTIQRSYAYTCTSFSG